MTDSILHAAPARTWIGPLMVFTGGVLIGLAPIGLRLGLEELGPQAIAFWRYLFAIPVLFALVLMISRRLPKPPNRLIIAAGCFFALDIACWHWALTLTTVSNATFIVNLGNVSVGFAAWIFLKDRPAPTWFVAILIAVTGAAALSLGGTGAGMASRSGDLLALVAAFLVSGYMLCSSLARRSLSGLDAIFWLTVVEMCVVGLIVPISGETFWPKTLAGFGSPIFLALAVQVGGQGLIITGLAKTPVSIAGVLVLVQPVVAAAISWQMFGEAMTAVQAGGAVLILIAVWLAQKGHRPQPVD